MIIILIIVLASACYGIYSVYKNEFGNDFIDYILITISYSLLGFLISFVITIALPMKTYTKIYSYEIASLQDNNNVNGRFFLGSGHIEGKMKYVYYYQEDGFYKMNQVDYNTVKIINTKSKPKVHVFEKFPAKSWINWIAYDTDIFDKTYIIEVPKGTIQTNYNLDAQ